MGIKKKLMLQYAAQAPGEAIIRSMDTLMQLATCHAWSRQEAIATAADGLLEHSTSIAGALLGIKDAIRVVAPACSPS